MKITKKIISLLLALFMLGVIAPAVYAACIPPFSHPNGYEVLYCPYGTQPPANQYYRTVEYDGQGGYVMDPNETPPTSSYAGCYCKLFYCPDCDEFISYMFDKNGTPLVDQTRTRAGTGAEGEEIKTRLGIREPNSCNHVTAVIVPYIVPTCKGQYVDFEKWFQKRYPALSSADVQQIRIGLEAEKASFTMVDANGNTHADMDYIYCPDCGAFGVRISNFIDNYGTLLVADDYLLTASTLENALPHSYVNDVCTLCGKVKDPQPTQPSVEPATTPTADPTGITSPVTKVIHIIVDFFNSVFTWFLNIFKI